MSTIETTTALPVPVRAAAPPGGKYARKRAPIVPPGSVAGRSLTLVIAIMCFLASLTAGAVYLVFQAANQWTNNISSQITIQIPQQSGLELSDEKIAEIAKFIEGQNGIKKVVPYTKEQSLKLVEVWIGKSNVLKDFPIPRLIAVEIDREHPPEISTLTKVMEAKYPGAILDDHGLWRSEIHRLTRILEWSGIAVILLMAAATVAVVVAAARSALASNREIVEVLNFVGAEEKFIASQFEAHFLKVGIRAGLAGVGAAALVYIVIPYVTKTVETSGTTAAEIKRVVGAGTLDWGGYVVLFTVVIVVAAICKMTSRYGVRHILNQHSV